MFPVDSGVNRLLAGLQRRIRVLDSTSSSLYISVSRFYEFNVAAAFMQRSTNSSAYNVSVLFRVLIVWLRNHHVL